METSMWQHFKEYITAKLTDNSLLILSETKSDKTKVELFGHNEHCYIWRRKWGSLQMSEHHH